MSWRDTLLWEVTVKSGIGVVVVVSVGVVACGSPGLDQDAYLGTGICLREYRGRRGRDGESGACTEQLCAVSNPDHSAFGIPIQMPLESWNAVGSFNAPPTRRCGFPDHRGEQVLMQESVGNS